MTSFRVEYTKDALKQLKKMGVSMRGQSWARSRRIFQGRMICATMGKA